LDRLFHRFSFLASLLQLSQVPTSSSRRRFLTIGLRKTSGQSHSQQRLSVCALLWNMKSVEPFSYILRSRTNFCASLDCLNPSTLSNLAAALPMVISSHSLEWAILAILDGPPEKSNWGTLPTLTEDLAAMQSLQLFSSRLDERETESKSMMYPQQSLWCQRSRM
jgi:hypothetical protein